MAPNKSKAKLDAVKQDLRLLREAEREGRIDIYPVEPGTRNKDARYDEIQEVWRRLVRCQIAGTSK